MTWSRHDQYIGWNLRSVSYANHLFVATANDGAILVSTNGRDWQTRFTGRLNNLRSIHYAAGVWIAVGNQGIVLTSTNAIDWTEHSPSITENLHGVRYFGNRFVTIGNRGTVLQSDFLSRPAMLSARFVAGALELSVTGDVGASYRVEATDQLPAVEWTLVRSIALVDPTTTFVDPAANGFATRFYRAVSR